MKEALWAWEGFERLLVLWVAGEWCGLLALPTSTCSG